MPDPKKKPNPKLDKLYELGTALPWLRTEQREPLPTIGSPQVQIVQEVLVPRGPKRPDLQFPALYLDMKFVLKRRSKKR